MVPKDIHFFPLVVITGYSPINYSPRAATFSSLMR